MARILLVRHGPSSHVHDGRWMHADDVRQYESAYNAAGILDADAPPAELLAAASSAHIVAASDLPRAIASARRLAPERDLEVSPLLREIQLEPPQWVTFPLPIAAWDLFNYVQWTSRLLATTDHESSRRGIAAVEWLLDRAETSHTVLAVTHGGFRRILDARLRALGWTPAPGRKSYANWSTWAYTR